MKSIISIFVIGISLLLPLQSKAAIKVECGYLLEPEFNTLQTMLSLMEWGVLDQFLYFQGRHFTVVSPPANVTVGNNPRTSTFFTFNQEFLEHIQGVVPGSPPGVWSIQSTGTLFFTVPSLGNIVINHPDSPKNCTKSVNVPF